MSIKVTDEPKCESALVPTTESTESSGSFESTIKISNEFIEIFKSTYTFSKSENKHSKKQIKAIESKIHKLFQKVMKSVNIKFDDIISLAYAYQYMCYGYLQVHQEVKLSAAKDFVLHSIHFIKDKELDPKIILLALKSYSYLGQIYYKQEKIENAIQIYDKAIELYLTYTEKNDEHSCPVDYEDIVLKTPAPLNGYAKIKKLHLHILESLIVLYSVEGPINHQSFILANHLYLSDCFNKLQETKKYKEWVAKVMELCDYFIMYNRFKEAHNHIITAVYVESAYLNADAKNAFEQKLFSKTFELRNQCDVVYDIINLYMIMYGTALLCRSTERLLRLEKNEDSEANNSTTECPSKSKKQISQRLLLFKLIDEQWLKINRTNQFPYKYISNYDEAHNVFFEILRIMYDSSLYFHPDKDIKTYMQYILRICNAYRYIALYEKNAASRLLLQNRRAEILMEAMILTRQHYRNESRYLQLQVAIAYSTIINTKLEHMESVTLPFISPEYDTIIVEINVLLAKGLINLQKYMQYK